VGTSGNELLLEVQVEGIIHQFLIDSGASVRLIKPGVSQAAIAPTDLAAMGITGAKLKSLGTQEVENQLGNRTYTHEFLVTPLGVDCSGVFGLDLLRRVEAKVDLCSGGLIVGRRRYDLSGLECQDRGLPQVSVMKPVAENDRDGEDLITPTGSTANASATGQQGAGRLDSLNCREMNPDCPTDSKHSHNTCSIVCAQMVAIPPKSRAVVMGRLSRGGQVQNLPRSVVVEPVTTQNPGVYVARVVSDTFVKAGENYCRLSEAPRSSLTESMGRDEPNGVDSDSDHENQGVPEEKGGIQGVPGREGDIRTVLTPESLGDHVEGKDREPCYCMIEIINTSASPIEIGKNVKLGEGEPLENHAEDARASREESADSNRLHDVYHVREVTSESSAHPELDKVIKGKLEHLVKAEREVLVPVMKEYYDLFLYDRSGFLPCTTKGFHEIKTGEALPIKKNVYKVPFALKDEMKKQLDEMIQRGIITPSYSEWAAPVVLVKKKSLDGKAKYRFCTDFRGLNAVTKIPVNPIPDIKGNLSLMAGSRYFTLLDIESAYWHIPNHPDDKDKTGFITPFGSFRYERLAYGLAGAPSTFQGIMDMTLMGLKDIYALVYLDDILIFSDSIEEHAHRIRMVLDRTREANFKLNLGKCTFAAREVAYLGQLVSADGVSPDASKVKAIKSFPLPRSVRDVRAILGLAGYYRSFIPNFAALSKPLTLLTRKDEKFCWSEPQQTSFDALKEALTSDSVLAHPEFDKPFILSCDASNYAISAILSQEHGGKERPLSFSSRILNKHEFNYSVTEKELLAVVWCTNTPVFPLWPEI